MKITENAISKLKTYVQPNTGLAEGIRIFQGNGCCGPAISMRFVKRPSSNDITESHEGINIYLDNQFAEFNNDITIDFINDYFQIKGIENINAGSCC